MLSIPSDEENKNGYKIIIEPFKFNYLFRNTILINLTEINFPITLNNGKSKIIGNIVRQNLDNFKQNLR